MLDRKTTKGYIVYWAACVLVATAAIADAQDPPTPPAETPQEENVEPSQPEPAEPTEPDGENPSTEVTDPADPASEASSVEAGATDFETEIGEFGEFEKLQDFFIGVSDSLSISVWKNPELNSSVPVLPDGTISLPLIGDVFVAGRTPAEVRDELNDRYAEFLTAPEVSLVVNGIRSRVFYVIGEVGRQGAQDLLLPTTILQALARSGGLSNYAKKDRVVVLRRVDDVEQYITLSIKGIENGKRPEDNILLEPGDTIIVP